MVAATMNLSIFAAMIQGFRGRRTWSELSDHKIFCYRQRAPLVGFQGNLLRQHDVPRNEILSRYEAPTYQGPTPIIELIDVHPPAIVYPVSPSGVAACNVEIIVRIVLRQLLRRKPFPQQLTTA